MITIKRKDEALSSIPFHCIEPFTWFRRECFPNLLYFKQVCNKNILMFEVDDRAPIVGDWSSPSHSDILCILVKVQIDLTYKTV